MLITGSELLAQRIMLRLRMRRGSWIFDDTKTLGSNLHFALRMDKPQALVDLDALILEALEPISDDVQITATNIRESETDERAVELVVEFQRVLPPGQTETPIAESEALVIVLPVVTGPSEV
jgi:phage gp46-like protein